MKFFLSIFLTLVFNNLHSQIITTVVGGGSGGGTDGYGSGLSATNATLGLFAGIVFDKYGNLYVADKDRQIIRKIDATNNIISTIAGNGVAGYSGDSAPATNANINSPGWLAFDSYNNLFFSDRTNNRIRKVNTSEIITTIAGNGSPTHSGEGIPATDASFGGLQGICIDNNNNIYFSSNYRIRKIDTFGIGHL